MMMMQQRLPSRRWVLRIGIMLLFVVAVSAEALNSRRAASLSAQFSHRKLLQIGEHHSPAEELQQKAGIQRQFQEFDLRRFLQSLAAAAAAATATQGAHQHVDDTFMNDLHRVPSSPNPIQNEFTDEVHH